MGDGFQPAGRPAAPAPLDLVQDFVNTEIPDWGRDDLADPTALVTWLAGRGLLAPDEAATERDVCLARRLRSGLRALALANTTGGAPEAATRRALDAALAELPVRLAVDETGLTVARAQAGVPGALVAIVAVVLAEQRSGRWERLKACRQDTCGWVFFDVSRNRSSGWCSMRVCGNRVKARRARQRRAGGRG